MTNRFKIESKIKNKSKIEYFPSYSRAISYFNDLLKIHSIKKTDVTNTYELIFNN